MSERRDFDDIKLIGTGELDIKDSDLRDLDVDLLAGPDLNADLLGDDFEEPLPRKRRRKSSSSGKLGLLLGVLVLGGGGAFAYLNKDALLPLVMGDTPRVARAPLSAPTDTMATQPLPATDPLAAIPSDIAGDLPHPDPILNDAVLVAPMLGDIVAVPVLPGANDLPLPPDAAVAVVPQPVAPVVPTPTVPDVTASIPTPVPNVPAQFEDLEKIAKNAVKKDQETLKQMEKNVQDMSTTLGQAKTALEDVQKNIQSAQQPKVTAPEGKAIDAGDLDVIKMPELPEIEKAMKGKDDYIESTTAFDDLSEQTAPRMNLSSEQKSAGLGVSVGDIAKPPTPNPTVITQSPGAVSGATMTTPIDVEGKVLAANRALDLERYQAAYDMFNELYKVNARDERILMGRAVSLQKLGRVDEAVRAYDELIAVNPDNPEVMINALTLVRGNNPTEALSRLLSLRQKYPTNSTIAAQIGLVNAELKNYDEGLRYLNIAADLESTNPKHFFNMAVIAERMGRTDLAVGYYERALKADALSGNTRNKLNRDLVYDRLSYLRQGATPAGQ